MTTPGRDDAGAMDPALSGLPDYPVNPFEPSGVYCDECEQVRPRTKSYSVLHVVFWLSDPDWRIDPVIKCPRCMRGYLICWLPRSLLLATIFAPFALLWWVCCSCAPFPGFARWVCHFGPRVANS